MTKKNLKTYSKQDVEKATLQYFKGDELAAHVWMKKYCLKDEMLRIGFDGLVIRGREMVNYTPDNDKIRYFENENQLIRYYEDFVQ